MIHDHLLSKGKHPEDDIQERNSTVVSQLIPMIFTFVQNHNDTVFPL